MTDPVGAALEWAAAPGPPNWVFVTAIVTAPAYWSEAVRARVGSLLDRILPGGGSS